MSEFAFLSPGRLVILALPFALVVGYLLLQARRRRYALRFTTVEMLDEVAPDRPGWRRHLTALGLIMAAVVTSAERGTSPLRRASARRCGVGSKTFSPPDPSLIADLEPAKATHCVAPVRRPERASAEAEGRRASPSAGSPRAPAWRARKRACRGRQARADLCTPNPRRNAAPSRQAPGVGPNDRRDAGRA